MIAGTAAVWVPVTLATPPADRATLKQFYARVRPPGWWRHVAIAAPGHDGWGAAVRDWIIATAALLATTIGPLELMLGRAAGWWWCAIGAVGWLAVGRSLLKPPQNNRGQPLINLAPDPRSN
jgi:hypothetical protein